MCNVYRGGRCGGGGGACDEMGKMSFLVVQQLFPHHMPTNDSENLSSFCGGARRRRVCFWYFSQQTKYHAPWHVCMSSRVQWRKAVTKMATLHLHRNILGPTSYRHCRRLCRCVASYVVLFAFLGDIINQWTSSRLPLLLSTIHFGRDASALSHLLSESMGSAYDARCACLSHINANAARAHTHTLDRVSIPFRKSNLSIKFV